MNAHSPFASSIVRVGRHRLNTKAETLSQPSSYYSLPASTKYGYGATLPSFSHVSANSRSGLESAVTPAPA